MPCTKDLNIDTSTPVLVTGATGFVAGVLIKQLAEAGLTIHATVRNPSDVEHHKYIQDVVDKTNGSIKFFEGDLLTPGSFDAAMEGCSIVFHTASPFAMSTKDDPQKVFIDPALDGTGNVMDSVVKTQSVKRVVLTSSCVAIYNHANDGPVFTEETWNRGATLTDNPYSLGKTLAETKAWVMAGGETRFSLVVINPTFIIGPGLKYHESSESFVAVRSFGTGAMDSGVPRFPVANVDVRDVAAAHIAAAYLPEARGRHILNGTNSSYPEIASCLHEKFPEYSIPTKISRMPKFIMKFLLPLLTDMTYKYVDGNYGETINFDNTKSKEQLGMDYIPMEESLKDMFQQIADAGAVEKKEDTDDDEEKKKKDEEKEEEEKPLVKEEESKKED